MVSKGRLKVFHIGDKIFYPMHGAGTIINIEENKILGEVHKYYVLQLPIKDMKVMLPISNTEAIGIREIISEDAANYTIDYFHHYDETYNGNWNKRYRENVEKIKSSNLNDVAEVAKALLIREQEKSLSNVERKLLNSSKNILISELVLAKQSTYDEIEALLSLNF